MLLFEVEIFNKTGVQIFLAYVALFVIVVFLTIIGSMWLVRQSNKEREKYGSR